MVNLEFYDLKIKLMEENKHETVCAICYTDVVQIVRDGLIYGACIGCDTAFCEPCTKDYLVHEAKSKYFASMDHIEFKCPQRDCSKTLDADDIRGVLTTESYSEILDALALRAVQASQDFIACPNTACGNYGFLENEKCSQDI